MNGLPEGYPLAELVTINMLAEELRQPYNRVRRWSDERARNLFPAPVGRFCGENFFVRVDVQHWLDVRAMTTKGRKALE